MKERFEQLGTAFPGSKYDWFDVANNQRFRDIPATEALASVIDALKPLGRPIVVGSFQAGFVVYQIAVQRPGSMHFVDTANLVTDDLRRCAPELLRPVRYTEKIPDAALAIHFDLLDSCGLGADVIYDTGPSERLRDTLLDHGYVFALEQVNESGFPMNFIAVRRGLLARYGIPRRTMVWPPRFEATPWTEKPFRGRQRARPPEEEPNDDAP